MNVRPFIAPPVENSVLAFYERHRSAFRLGTHLLLWAITIILASYTIPIATKGHTFATNKLIVITVLQTMGYYYVMGYVIIPRYLYQFRPAPLLFWSAGIFWLIHLSNYVTFYSLHQFNTEISVSANSYIERNWTLFRQAGLFGCFTNLRVALLNLVYSMNVSLLYLLPKISKDLVSVRTRTLRLERDKIKLERDNLDLELDFLKTQVNPHFLFNVLNSIYADVFDANEKAADLILRLSELMRYNLYETNLPKIILTKELDYIRNYLDLERNRLVDQYVVIDYEQEGDSASYQITPLLLIAFVENAFKHGVKGTNAPAYVQVNARVSDGVLHFQVENSIPPKRPFFEGGSQSGGVGLGNVRRRLDAFYEGRYELAVEPAQESYTIRLSIQLEPLS